jgi:hypothetical protein
MSEATRLGLARIVWAHHLMVVGLVAFGWALPWRGALWGALALYPIVLLNWWVFGNRCVLSVVEERLRGTSARASGQTEEPLHFVQLLGSRLVGRPVPRVWADIVSYGVVCFGFAITGLRLYLGMR